MTYNDKELNEEFLNVVNGFIDYATNGAYPLDVYKDMVTIKYVEELNRCFIEAINGTKNVSNRLISFDEPLIIDFLKISDEDRSYILYKIIAYNCRVIKRHGLNFTSSDLDVFLDRNFNAIGLGNIDAPSELVLEQVIKVFLKAIYDKIDTYLNKNDYDKLILLFTMLGLSEEDIVIVLKFLNNKLGKEKEKTVAGNKKKNKNEWVSTDVYKVELKKDTYTKKQQKEAYHQLLIMQKAILEEKKRLTVEEYLDCIHNINISSSDDIGYGEQNFYFSHLIWDEEVYKMMYEIALLEPDEEVQSLVRDTKSAFTEYNLTPNDADKNFWKEIIQTNFKEIKTRIKGYELKLTRKLIESKEEN